MKKTYILLLSIIILFACNPEDLDVSDGTPKFKAEMELDGVSKSFEAGSNDFFLEPDYELKNGVLSFTSSFMKEDPCSSNCLEQLKIRINDIETYEPAGFDIAQSLMGGSIDYVSSEELSLAFTFLQVINTSVGDTPFNASWDIGGFDFQSIFQDVISVEIPEINSNLNIGLHIQGPECNSSMSKDYANNNLMSYCDASIKIISTQGIKAAKVEAYGVPPFDVKWNDVNLLDTVSGLLILREDHQEVLSATVTDAIGCSVDVRLNMHGNISQNCQADFRYNILEPEMLVVGLSKVTIEYIDPEGTVFRTDKAMQDEFSNFQILDIMDYKLDDKGNPTKELVVEFDCLLSSADHSRTLRISNANAVIAVSYPAN